MINIFYKKQQQHPLFILFPCEKKNKWLTCETFRIKWRDFQQQPVAADELSGDCDPAVKPGGLLCCSNQESASEETYLLLGNVVLALLTLRTERIHSLNAV